MLTRLCSVYFLARFHAERSRSPKLHKRLLETCAKPVGLRHNRGGAESRIRWGYISACIRPRSLTRERRRFEGVVQEMRIETTDERQRLWENLLEATDQSAKSKALDDAARYYCRASRGMRPGSVRSWLLRLMNAVRSRFRRFIYPRCSGAHC